uniref:BAH domain-containing protein n=1 Tax=Caenorhabditis japonica TaxID=281687 RepID=A0A8R1ERI4_CAEJA
MFATPYYETLPLDEVIGRCLVVDTATWSEGRPKVPKFKEDDVFLCEMQIGKNQRFFEKIPQKNRYPINTQPYVFTKFSQPKKILRNFRRGLGSAEIARTPSNFVFDGSNSSRHFAGGPFILQQDWAPSHGSRSTLAVLEAHFPGFLDKNLWPASSPDLNPMDFSVWGMLEGKIAGKVFATVDDLKAALEVAWASIDDGYLRRTVNSPYPVNPSPRPPKTPVPASNQSSSSTLDPTSSASRPDTDARKTSRRNISRLLDRVAPPENKQCVIKMPSWPK